MPISTLSVAGRASNLLRRLSSSGNVNRNYGSTPIRYVASVLLLVCLMTGSFTAKAQQNFFTPVASSQLRVAAPEIGAIRKYTTYQLKTAELRTYLAKAPLENQSAKAALRLEIPLPNGTVETFAVFESPILAPAVAAQHPDIKTYTGKGETHRTYTIRLSFTPTGFDAIILGVDGDAVYYTKASADPADRLYITYFARDAKKTDTAKPFGTMEKCGSTAPAVEAMPENLDGRARQNATLNNTGTTLRTFRLAMAATGEFTQRKGGGNVTTAFNALVTYVNRMNAVYRTELSVAFVLVSGTNIVYPNANTDPYTNTDQAKMLDENQVNLTNVIGTANYDVGHVLGAVGGSGGGIAAASSVCKDDRKGQGVSGVGDGSFAAVFDDQLISHEVGHQFSMSHTFNSSIPVCTTREATTSVETGSGTTIMSYGYTCSNNTGNDDYESPYQPFLNFHTISYQQAITYIGTVSCFTSTPLTNAVPVITSFPTNTTIPKSTPFALTGAATDTDAGDVLSYSWEGTNIGTVVPDASTFANTAQPPFFRSYIPVATGTRTFPRLDAILNGTNNARGDKLPSVGIATTHRLTVRDNAGGLTYQTVTVTVDGNSGPFLETTNLAGSYPGNSSQTITWSVANTTAPPVNCATVNILLSTDGGQTFPTTLLANTPNDGSEPVTFPALTTNMARIKVVSSNNIFFDISNANFTIVDPNNQPPVAPTIANQTGTVDVPFNFTVPAFTDPENQALTYTVSGLPASLTFNSTTRVIGGTPNALITSTIKVVATDPGSATASASFTLTINPAAAVPLLVTLTANPTALATTGSVVLSAAASGGRPSYTYSFDGYGSISSSVNSATVSGMSAGVQTFTVTVTDNTLPTSQTATATVNVTVLATGGPIVKVNSNDPSSSEGGGVAARSVGNNQQAKNSQTAGAPTASDPGFIQFERSNTTGPLVVNYQIGGTATNGTDFVSLPTSVTFVDGQSILTEEIDPIEDDIVEGDETISITLVDSDSYDPDPNEITTTVTIRDNDTSPFSITGVTTVSCLTLSAGQRQVRFTPQYVGLSGDAVSFSVVNELSPTMASGPYTLNLYTDNPVITLKAAQSGTSGEASFSYNWLAVCTGSVSPPPGSPFSITGVTTVSCQTLSAGQRQVSFTPQYAGLSGDPISFSVVNELSPTTASGPYTLNLYTDNPVITLKATQSGTSGEASFSYNWLAVCTSSVSPPPGSPFSITGVTTVSCQTLSAGQRRVSFTPQYAGLSGDAVSFSVVNELSPTMAAGPYTLNLYTDNSSIILKATQNGTVGEASFTYNWLAACTSNARIGAESSVESVLEVLVMGNPTQNGQVRVEVRGVAGQPLQLSLTDARGQLVGSQFVEKAGLLERHTFEVSRQPVGVLLLRATTPIQSQTVKVLKVD